MPHPAVYYIRYADVPGCDVFFARFDKPGVWVKEATGEAVMYGDPVSGRHKVALDANWLHDEELVIVWSEPGALASVSREGDPDVIRNFLRTLSP